MDSVNQLKGSAIRKFVEMKENCFMTLNNV